MELLFSITKDSSRAMNRDLKKAMAFSVLSSKSRYMNIYDAVISKRGLPG